MHAFLENALASLAVKDIKATSVWYEQLLGSVGSAPMAELREWQLRRGGGLQVYEDPQRAGMGSCTFAVNDLDAVVDQLEVMGIDTSKRTSSDQVCTVMITDSDGNHVAFAQALDPRLAR